LRASLTGDELLRLASRHFKYPHGETVAALIVQHPSADKAVFRRILDHYPDSTALANDIATSGRCDAEVLGLLRKCPAASVREHAALGLVRLELERNDPRSIRRLLAENQGDFGVALGVRHMIAMHANTPDDILKELREDEADFIADAARKEISRRRHRRQ
jgi:hypothetical protein